MDIYKCDKCNYHPVRLWYKKYYGEHIWKFCSNCKQNYKWLSIHINTQKVGVIEEMSKKKFYSVVELAKLIDRTPSMVRYYVRIGAIPFNKIGGHVVFSEDHVPSIKWYLKTQGTKRGVKTRV